MIDLFSNDALAIIWLVAAFFFYIQGKISNTDNTQYFICSIICSAIWAAA